MPRNAQQRKAGFDALLAHIERANRFAPPSDDCPQLVEDLEECGIPRWAQCADTWPEPWRTMHADLEKLPAIDRGPAEAVIQRSFLHALSRVRESDRHDKSKLPKTDD